MINQPGAPPRAKNTSYLVHVCDVQVVVDAPKFGWDAPEWQPAVAPGQIDEQDRVIWIGQCRASASWPSA
jgi:hypothetical protein